MDLIKKNPNPEITSLQQQTDRPLDSSLEQKSQATLTQIMQLK